MRNTDVSGSLWHLLVRLPGDHNVAATPPTATAPKRSSGHPPDVTLVLAPNDWFSLTVAISVPLPLCSCVGWRESPTNTVDG